MMKRPFHLPNTRDSQRADDVIAEGGGRINFSLPLQLVSSCTCFDSSIAVLQDRHFGSLALIPSRASVDTQGVIPHSLAT